MHDCDIIVLLTLLSIISVLSSQVLLSSALAQPAAFSPPYLQQLVLCIHATNVQWNATKFKFCYAKF